MRFLMTAGLAAAAIVLCSAAAFAGDFEKSFNVSTGGSVRITNMSGNVTVRGYDGRDVVVTGIKKGDDRDMIEIVDSSSGNNVVIGVEYPRRGNTDADVDFEVKVPYGASLTLDKISSMSGNVTIEDVHGRINASTMSGNVYVRNVEGTVRAKTMSGDVDVSIKTLTGDGSLEFSSMSGNVEVALPESAGLDVTLRTTSGSVDTDFGIQVHRPEYGPGEWAKGRIGDGSRALSASSTSGNVRLRKF